MQNNLTWATLSAVVGLIVAWISITSFVLEPLELRLENARQNYLRSLTERDARMDYLQHQIDELERKYGRDHHRDATVKTAFLAVPLFFAVAAPVAAECVPGDVAGSWVLIGSNQGAWSDARSRSRMTVLTRVDALARVARTPRRRGDRHARAGAGLFVHGHVRGTRLFAGHHERPACA